MRTGRGATGTPFAAYHAQASPAFVLFSLVFALVFSLVFSLDWLARVHRVRARAAQATEEERPMHGMQSGAPQQVPVKMYRSEDRLSVAALMPGLEADDVAVEVTGDGRLILRGALRGEFKGQKDILLNEWQAGNYERSLQLPLPVDGAAANVTYGNGVVVVVLPISDHTSAAQLTLRTLGPTRGEVVGNSGHDWSESAGGPATQG